MIFRDAFMLCELRKGARRIVDFVNPQHCSSVLVVLMKLNLLQFLREKVQGT